MRIAVDVMGGDKAPDEIIAGALKAAEVYKDMKLILVGKNDMIIKKLRNNYPKKKDIFKIVNAPEKISMKDKPSMALKRKKNSSINIGTKMVKNKTADAFVSAGNTGAVMGAGVINIGRISGIKRPSIATIYPSLTQKTLVLDGGANVDCKPENLKQFAIMGEIYSKNVLQVRQPKIGLLNIGEEKEKGNKLTTASYTILKNERRISNFIGNVEGRDIFNDRCNVIVCDGFTGNIVLKTTEGAVSFLMSKIKSTLKYNILTKLGALILNPFLNRLKNEIDYRKYGGAPLLGIKGVVIISHGSSDAEAIFNAIKVARETVEKKVVDSIEYKINREGETNDT
ncbi:MAG: phosphate acyltransferase PlsX [Halanaerobiaceae bacterium]